MATEKQKHALKDAQELHQILRTANCMERYEKISHEILAELLVALATGGEVIGGNNRGSDVRSPAYGLIEVKSRILGTDGPFPRISLKRSNIEKAQWFAAVRWKKDYAFYDAVMLPKARVQILYDARKQASGLAHIAWNDWIEDSAAQSIRPSCLRVLQAAADADRDAPRTVAAGE